MNYLKQLIVRAHTSGGNHQVQYFEVNNTLDNLQCQPVVDQNIIIIYITLH